MFDRLLSAYAVQSVHAPLIDRFDCSYWRAGITIGRICPPSAHCSRAGEVAIESDQRLSVNSMSPILRLSRAFRTELSAPNLQAAAL